MHWLFGSFNVNSLTQNKNNNWTEEIIALYDPPKKSVVPRWKPHFLCEVETETLKALKKYCDFVNVNIVGQNYCEDDFFRKVKTLRAFCQKVVSFYDGILERLVK